MKFLIKFIIFAVAVYITAWLVPGIDVSGIKGAIVVSLVMGLLNTFVKPIVKLLALPVTLLTLGLFALVINAVFIELCAYLVPDSFVVTSFLSALIYSVALSVVSWVLSFIFISDK
jgi:Predicted membrane protein